MKTAITRYLFLILLTFTHHIAAAPEAREKLSSSPPPYAHQGHNLPTYVQKVLKNSFKDEQYNLALLCKKKLQATAGSRPLSEAIFSYFFNQYIMNIVQKRANNAAFHGGYDESHIQAQFFEINFIKAITGCFPEFDTVISASLARVILAPAPNPDKENQPPQ